MLDAELIEISPRVDPGVVQIVEGDAHRVIADRLQSDDSDMCTAGDQGLLPGSVPLHLGRRALDPQILGRQAEPAESVENESYLTWRAISWNGRYGM